MSIPNWQIDENLRQRIEEIARDNSMNAEDLVREAVEAYARRKTHNGSSGAAARRKPLSALAAEISAAVPAEEWDKLPRDLAKNFDHYHYGHPREN